MTMITSPTNEKLKGIASANNPFFGQKIYHHGSFSFLSFSITIQIDLYKYKLGKNDKINPGSPKSCLLKRHLDDFKEAYRGSRFSYRIAIICRVIFG